jgi:hypothetical protein
MVRLSTPVAGELIDRVVELGYGFLRVGVDIVKQPSLYTELTLTDISGNRSPIETIVTGIKSNWDKRIVNGGTAIIRVVFSNVDVDDLVEQGAPTDVSAMSSDFAAVDTPGTKILPGELTPSDSAAGVLKERDTSSINDGAVFVWSRKFWSKYGQASINK